MRTNGNTKPRGGPRPLHLVCTQCGHYGGQVANLAEANLSTVCDQCGAPNTAQKTKPGRREARHAGGLSPSKYLEPEALAQVCEYVRAQAEKNKSLLADTNWLVVDILSRAGLRAQELCDLQIRDVPILHNTDTIEVRDGKGRVSRVVKIPSTLSEHIREYVRTRRPGATADSYLIEARTGNKMAYKTLYYKIVGLGREMGLPQPLYPHKFRHSYACWVYEQTHDLLWLAEQLGHANPQTTMIYAKTTSAKGKQNAEMLA